MTLVDLEQAKRHLHIPPTTTDRDADVQDITEHASGIIVDYLKSRADDGWSTGTVAVPVPIQRATLLLIAHFDEHRGDDMRTAPDCWKAIEYLLVRYRDPALV